MSIKEVFFAYADLHHHLKELNRNLFKEKKLFEANQAQQKEFLHEKIRKESTWIGYLVAKLSERTGLLGKIHTLFMRFFNRYHETSQEWQKLNSLVINQTELLIKQKSKLKELTAQYKQVKEQILPYASKCNHVEAVQALMIDACGGQEKYDALPVLDLGEREGKTLYIDFIKEYEMTAPIMKFEDKFGRKGIAVRTEEGVQTFFHRYKQEATWSDAGRGISITGYFIDQGLVNKTAFLAIETLLGEGKVILPTWDGRMKTLALV